MGPSILLLFLLTSELTATHGGLVQLYRMVTQVSGKAAIPYYSSYGCYCGLRGRGRPKDATDRCCQRHDCCYDWLQKWGCRPHTTCYSYSYSDWRGKIQCGSGANWCQEEICGCDRALALCLKGNADWYEKKYTFYPNFLCRGPTPPCSSHLEGLARQVAKRVKQGNEQ